MLGKCISESRWTPGNSPQGVLSIISEFLRYRTCKLGDAPNRCIYEKLDLLLSLDRSLSRSGM